jgi:drug/metabolite transporter (DMT)-like permease
MSLLLFLLVLAASVSSSGFDLFRKMLVRHLAPVPMVVLLAIASVPLFGAAVLFGGPVAVQPAYWLPALGSVALNVVANLTFLQAVRISPLSVTVPLLSLTPVFTALLGFAVLRERPAPLDLVGIALVVVGAFWLNLGMTQESGGGEGEGKGTTRAFLSQPGAWLMAGTALLLSLTIPLDKLAVGRASPPFHGLVLTAGIALGSLAVLAVQKRWGELAGLRRGWLPFVLALTASTLALGFQLVALQAGVLVSLLETLKRGIGNLLAVILGRAAFGETVTPGKLGAALLMAAGVALILL